MKTKCYPHVTGLYGDQGENPSALSVHAVLDPSPNYPESGRIIVGSPATTPTIPGYIPNLGGFNGGPAAIERLAATLLEAARDVRAAMAGNQEQQPVTKLDLADLEARIRELENERAKLEPRARVADVLEVEMAKLLPLADAATAFVDEQGKIPMDALLDNGFEGERFDDLVKALEAAGR